MLKRIIRAEEGSGRDFPQLIDLFSLPWAGLLSTVVHYCDMHTIAFDPKSLYDDIAVGIPDRNLKIILH